MRSLDVRPTAVTTSDAAHNAAWRLVERLRCIHVVRSSRLSDETGDGTTYWFHRTFDAYFVILSADVAPESPAACDALLFAIGYYLTTKTAREGGDRSEPSNETRREWATAWVDAFKERGARHGFWSGAHLVRQAESVAESILYRRGVRVPNVFIEYPEGGLYDRRTSGSKHGLRRLLGASLVARPDGLE